MGEQPHHGEIKSPQPQRDFLFQVHVPPPAIP